MLNLTTIIPEVEPLSITCGETVKWNKDLTSVYSAASGWALTYYFIGKTAWNKAATISGTKFAITLSAAETNQLEPDENYRLVGRVSKAGEVFTIYDGTLEVLKNPVNYGSGDETRSHARICLDKIKAVLENRASRDDLSYSIQGRSLSKMSFKELIDFRNYYEAEVRAENEALALQRGESPRKNVLIRFRNP